MHRELAPGGTETVTAPAVPDILLRHLDALRAAASRLVGEPEGAEDLVQDALASAAGSLKELRHPEVAGVWLLQILRRRWYDLLRRRAVERRAREGMRSPARAAESGVDSDLVRRALAELRVDDRRLLELRFFESLDPAEIGRRLGKTPGNVRSLLFHALRRFETAWKSACAGGDE